MPDHLGWVRIAAMLVYRFRCNVGLQVLDAALSCKKKQKEEGPARASPVAAPMPKSDSF